MESRDGRLVRAGRLQTEDSCSTWQSPVAPSVCPTEISTAPSALDASDHPSCSSSESDTDCSIEDLDDLETLQHWANWAEVGNRLGGVFARAANNNDDGSDGEWQPSRHMTASFAAASRQGPGSVATCSVAKAHHQGEGQDGTQRQAYQALLEHYEVFGVSSGLWRQRRGMSDDEPEAEQ